MTSQQHARDPLNGFLQTRNWISVGDTNIALGMVQAEILAGCNCDMRFLQNAPRQRKTVVGYFLTVGINIERTFRLNLNYKTQLAQCRH